MALKVGIIDGTLLTVKLTPFSILSIGNILTRRLEKEVTITSSSPMVARVLMLYLESSTNNREHLENNSTETQSSLKEI